jgi:hypothetical protein
MGCIGYPRLLGAAFAAAIAVAFPVGSANAATFNVIGSNQDLQTLTGSMDIDTNLGQITSVDFQVGGEDFTKIIGSLSLTSALWEVAAQNPSSTSDEIGVAFLASSLVGFNGSTFTASDFSLINAYFGSLPCGGIQCDVNMALAQVTFGATLTPVAQTPLPAALPLFATGLGALGLFAWRRKRKAQATA